PRALSHHHSEDSPRVSSQRHPNPELLGALIHRKTHHAIETNRGQNECDDSEDAEERCDNAVSAKNLVVESRRCSGEISRQIGIYLRHSPAQRRPQGFSSLSRTWTNNDRAKLRGR